MNLLHRKAPIHTAGLSRSAAVTIRWATPADAPQVAVLADLDEDSVPMAPLLLAFVDDELWVAFSLSTGATISDPFRPSAEVAALLRERGRQLTVAELGRPRSTLIRLRSRMRASHDFDPRTSRA
jgi:hypothetical protein